jgi:zinc D-Ala-D-Ala dipeptidase
MKHVLYLLAALGANAAFAQSPPAGWVNILDLDPTIQTDIRYATSNNFVKAQMYDCPACYFRERVAQALLKAHHDLRAAGYGGLKFYDCYRPAPYQQRLWNKMPDARFVTPPRKGSMHSRGGAADLTVIDKQGNELDMGTPFDSFDPKSYQTCTNLPPQVLQNRNLLRQALERYGFRHIRTEWWHFAYIPQQYPVANWLWHCP